MAEETKKTPQTPEEIAREAQAQAMKAALEQAQALYGNVPGFEGTDLMKMHEKLMQDSAEMFPGVAEAQAYQAKMMAESAQDPEAIMETYSKNIEFAGNMMQQAMNAGFMPEGLPDFSDGFDVYAGWEITRKGDNSLTPEQNKLLAYGHLCSYTTMTTWTPLKVQQARTPLRKCLRNGGKLLTGRVPWRPSHGC